MKKDNLFTLKLIRLGLLSVALLIIGISMIPQWHLRVDRLTAQSSPFSSIFPTSTPFAIERNRIANEIIHPGPGDAGAGFIELRGTALINSYRRHDVHISPSGAENWRWLHSSFDIVRDEVIYALDSTQFPDGAYDIRLRAVRENGDYEETFLRGLAIRNAAPPTPTLLFNEQGTPQPAVLLPTATPDPTATPRYRVRIQDGIGFYSPDDGAALRGYVPVVATVNGTNANPFDRYELAVSAAGQEAWRWLHSDAQQIWQDQIYVLDTNKLPDGFYDLRLRIVYRDSNYDEFYLRNLQIANAGNPIITAPNRTTDVIGSGFTAPIAGQTVAGTVDFEGSALDSDFLRWELYWSPSGQEAWSFLVSDNRPVVDDVLARLDLGQLDPGIYDFRLRIVNTNTNYDEYFLRDLNVVAPARAATPGSTPSE